MKKPLLILFLFSVTLLLGCTKSELENIYGDSSSDSLPGETVSVLYLCNGKKCHVCGGCREEYHYGCDKCTCFNDYGYHSNCPKCGGCIDRRANSGYCHLLSCECQFEIQIGNFDCFITAMFYAGTISGHYMTTIEEMYDACSNAGLDLSNGIRYFDVEHAMRAVFGNKFGNETGTKYDMEDLLDNNFTIITNYLLDISGGPYAHAVVIVGYSGSGSNIRYACLDPGTGEYVFKRKEDLEWKDGNGEDNKNKFLVAIPNNN